ncbi:hypothetical protein N786_16160 [Bacillus amyloliquefaciens UASWS BA1]|nr:hypothetical protein N786_16160 [Bacillus amyloliquefaciens UASWS BA1]
MWGEHLYFHGGILTLFVRFVSRKRVIMCKK